MYYFVTFQRSLAGFPIHLFPIRLKKERGKDYADKQHLYRQNPLTNPKCEAVMQPKFLCTAILPPMYRAFKRNLVPLCIATGHAILFYYTIHIITPSPRAFHLLQAGTSFPIFLLHFISPLQTIFVNSQSFIFPAINSTSQPKTTIKNIKAFSIIVYCSIFIFLIKVAVHFIGAVSAKHHPC